MRLSQLRRGRSLVKKNGEARRRAGQPRFAQKKLQSKYSAAPRKPRPTQPHLGIGTNLSDIL